MSGLVLDVYAVISAIVFSELLPLPIPLSDIDRKHVDVHEGSKSG